MGEQAQNVFALGNEQTDLNGERSESDKNIVLTGRTKVQGLDPAKHKNSVSCEVKL